MHRARASGWLPDKPASGHPAKGELGPLRYPERTGPAPTEQICNLDPEREGALLLGRWGVLEKG